LNRAEDADSFGAFWGVVLAWNGYFKGPDISYLKGDLEELFSEHDNIEIHNPVLRDETHFGALCKALLFCDRFKRLSLVNYTISKPEEVEEEKKEGEDGVGGGSGGGGGEAVQSPDEKKVWQVLESALVELLSHSFGLRQLTLSGLPLTYNFFKNLDDMVKKKRAASNKTPRSTSDRNVGSNIKNADNSVVNKEKGKDTTDDSPQQRNLLPVEDLEISDIKIDDRSGALLADTLKIVSKTLVHVNFSGTKMQPATIHLICEALLFCTGVTLKHIDFSNCSFDTDSTSSLSPVLAAGTCLQYLGLRNCEGIDISGTSLTTLKTFIYLFLSFISFLPLLLPYN